MFFTKVPLSRSCEILEEMTSSSPAAVDNAAAMPPAAGQLAEKGTLSAVSASRRVSAPVVVVTRGARSTKLPSVVEAERKMRS